MATRIPKKFFLDGDLHRKISVVPSENILVAWSFPKEGRMHYNYQQVLRRFQHGFTIRETAELLEQPLLKLKKMVHNNILSRGSGVSYSIANRKPGPVYWSEDDLLNMRSELFAIAKKNEYGEPVDPKFNLISEAELLHKIRGGESYYVKNRDGEFVKVWRAV